MSAVEDVGKQKTWHIMSLYAVVGMLGLIIFYGINVIQGFPKEMTIYTPPDLSQSYRAQLGAVPNIVVCNFATNTLQKLYRWHTNGRVNYWDNIVSLQNYLTPKYREFLKKDHASRISEITNRERTAQFIPGETCQPDDVKVLEDGTWHVNLKLEINDHVRSLRSKQVYIEYPFHVVRMLVSPEENPWGLAINGYMPGMNSIRIDHTFITAAK